MSKTISFNELLESVDNLSLNDQESLVDIIHHRIAEYRRKEFVTLISSAREEYRQGKLIPETSQDIMNSLLS